MQATANFHDHISCPRLPETADVVDDAAALDATVHRLDPTRRRAMRRLTAVCARVRARPLAFLGGMITSTWWGVVPEGPIRRQPLTAGKGYGVSWASRLSWVRPP